MKNPQSNLPPGFRFHPTDEELILHYLKKKVASTPFPVSIIADVDIYKFNPWDLPDKATFGEKEWYFFSPRDRKYPNGARPNRSAASGYWKATGTDKIITASTVAAGASGGGGGRGGGVVQENIGVKKALVFYKGRPPKGIKTNWIMHEYRLADAPTFNHKPIKPKDSTTMRLDDWVLCRIYKKTHASPQLPASATAASDHDQEEEEEEQQHQQQSLKENLLPPSFPSPVITSKSLMPQKSSSFSNLLDPSDYSLLSSFLSDNNQFHPTGYDSNPTLNPSAMPDQPFFINFNPNISNSSSYLLQKLPPQMNNNDNNNYNPSPLMPNMGNKQQKRPLCTIDEDIHHHHNPSSKKFISSCSFTNNTGQSDHHLAHNQYSFLTQQLLLSPHFQFQS